MNINENKSGCRALIASIINNAIVDATGYRNPKTPLQKEILIKKYDEICIQCLYVLSNSHIYSVSFMQTCFKSLKYYNDSIRKLSKKNEKEYLSLEARRFLNAKTYLFKAYVSLLDIDPEYFEEKINSELRKFDKGLKNNLKNPIDILKVNTL